MPSLERRHYEVQNILSKFQKNTVFNRKNFKTNNNLKQLLSQSEIHKLNFKYKFLWIVMLLVLHLYNTLINETLY